MSDHASPAKARRRADVKYAVLAVIAVAAFAGLAIWLQGLSHDLRVSNEARDALARQVQSLGHKPVAGPPGSRGEPGRTVVGSRGPKGETGASGKPAPTVTPSPGPSGPPGATATGPPGADSTIPGPSGPPGENATGVPGQDGKDGADGAAGKDGSDGRDGQPPAGWTYTDPNGVTYDCTPVDDFDPNAPRYRCTPSSGGGSDPTPESPSSPNLAALAPDRRRY